MKTKKVRRLTKGPLLNVATSIGKWTPHDDYLLIQGVMQLMSIEDVHKVIKFSQKFAAKELEDRWYAVLYDVPISKMIYKNLKKLHFDDILRLKKLAPFSRDEEAILLNFNTESPEDDDDDDRSSAFEKLLQDHRVHFHEGRTADNLRKHWQRMRKLNLLAHQQPKLVKSSSTVNKHGLLAANSNLLSCSEVKHSLTRPFTELENDLDDQQIMESVELDDQVEAEISECYEEVVKQIQRSEAELFLWQVLIDKITGVTNPFLDLSTFAVLFFGEESFAMTKLEIVVGRSSDSDFDLSKLKELREENDATQSSPSYKMNMNSLSRKQFRIAMHNDVRQNGGGISFYLYNDGKLPIYVDGKVLLTRTKTQLYDKSFIEIGAIQILFLVNVNLIAKAMSKQT